MYLICCCTVQLHSGIVPCKRQAPMLDIYLKINESQGYKITVYRCTAMHIQCSAVLTFSSQETSAAVTWQHLIRGVFITRTQGVMKLAYWCSTQNFVVHVYADVHACFIFLQSEWPAHGPVQPRTCLTTNHTCSPRINQFFLYQD